MPTSQHPRHDETYDPESSTTADAATISVANARRRAARRHMVVGGASVALVGLLMLVTELSQETWGMPDHRKTDGSLWQFNVATGTVALVLVVATLAYRPVRLLTGRSTGPIHFPWRRTMGIWAAIAVVAHIPGGLAIHSTAWQIWTPFESVFPWVDGRPFDEYTVGYWAGLVAAVAMVPLVITSRNGALRKMGARAWQRRHRVWIWTLYWVLAVHVVALQYGEFRNLRHVAVTAAIFATALAARVLMRWRSARGRRGRGDHGRRERSGSGVTSPATTTPA